MSRLALRLYPVLTFLAALLALAGCAQSNMGGTGSTAARPKTVVVSDFVVSSDVGAVDHGYAARHEAKGGNFPILERRQRALERINDEIVATIIATLHEAGLEAQPGTEQGLSFSDDAVLVTGRLRPNDKAKPSQMNQIGFGPGRSGVVADMTLTRVSTGGKKPLLTFAADGGRRPGVAVNAKIAATRNAAIAQALATENAAPEKLSSDVEVQARSLGRAIGDKIVTFAKEQGWLTKPDVAEAQPDEKPAHLPPSQPEKKPAKPEQENPKD